VCEATGMISHALHRISFVSYKSHIV